MANRQTRVTDTQKEMLVAYMEGHIQLHRSKFDATFSSNTARQLWQELAELLNDHGSIKTWDKWRQTWRDMCTTTKQHVAAIRKSADQTGNPEPCPIGLTQLQERIATIIGDTLIMGDPTTGEAGFGAEGDVPATAFQHRPTETLDSSSSTSMEDINDGSAALHCPAKPATKATTRKAVKRKIAAVQEPTRSDRLLDLTERRAVAEERRAVAEQRQAVAQEKLATSHEELVRLVKQFLQPPE